MIKPYKGAVGDLDHILYNIEEKFVGPKYNLTLFDFILFKNGWAVMHGGCLGSKISTRLRPE